MTDLLAPVAGMIGRRLLRVERVLYEFQGALDSEDGEVQLTFESATLRLGTNADGETLRITGDRWRDPFEGKLDEANRRYVEKHGRWVLVDLSSRPPHQSVVGDTLRDVRPIGNMYGKLVGLQLVFGAEAMNVFVDADETKVSWGLDGLPRWRT
jgi:hypothetical protein